MQEQIDWLSQWIAEHRQWSRKRFARQLCELWQWRDERGRLKDFAARSPGERAYLRRLGFSLVWAVHHDSHDEDGINSLQISSRFAQPTWETDLEDSALCQMTSVS